MRVDAEELDQKALNAEQDKKLPCNHAGPKRMLYRPRAAPPYIPADEHGGDEFIDRRGMHRAILRPAINRACAVRPTSGNQTIRKGHAPGTVRRLAIVAVAGYQAADAAHSVPDGRRRAGNIQHREHVHAIATRDDQQCSNAGDKAPEPGKAATEPAEERTKALESFGGQAVGGRIDDVPDLCAQDSGEGHNRHDGVRIKLDFPPLDLAFQGEVRGGKSHYHQQAESRYFQRPNVYIRKQLVPSMG